MTDKEKENYIFKQLIIILKLLEIYVIKWVLQILKRKSKNQLRRQ